jgi:hypothetical protein
MFEIWQKYKWKKQARLKLNDSNRKSSNEYLEVLKNQSNGRCVSCGTGKIKSFTTDKNINIIEFNCGHRHKEVFINESINIRESIKMLLVPDGKGKRNFIVKHIQGWFKSASPDLRGGVFKEQIIDKRNNKYKEKVVNALDKNDVIKDQEQPLSKHQGYGSAKFKK